MSALDHGKAVNAVRPRHRQPTVAILLMPMIGALVARLPFQLQLRQHAGDTDPATAALPSRLYLPQQLVHPFANLCDYRSGMLRIRFLNARVMRRDGTANILKLRRMPVECNFEGVSCQFCAAF